MTKRTKKVGITGKYSTRYGAASLPKQVKRTGSHNTAARLPVCGKNAVKRTAVGICNYKACSKTTAREPTPF
jgi:large subunit ribosomal protein L37Ae